MSESLYSVHLHKPGYYAGVGSRETPEPILDQMTAIAYRLERTGWTLRSGGATGADTAFEDGARTLREIYLPWNGFCHRQEDGRTTFVVRKFENRFQAMQIAAKHHPHWHRLGAGPIDLHTRNVYQVLGRDLQTPSSFLICWTPDGSIGDTTELTGGTGQAIRIARSRDVPIWNLARDRHLQIWEEWMSRR